MPADPFTMSPSLTFVKQATWIGHGLLRLMRPRSRSLRSIFFIGGSICMGNSLLIDLAQSPSPSPAAFRHAGVYNDNFRTLMPDREMSDGTLLRPELCNNEIAVDPCRIRFSSSRKNCMEVFLRGTSRMTVPRNSTVLRATIVVDPAEPTQRLRLPFSESSAGPPTTSLRPEGFIAQKCRDAGSRRRMSDAKPHTSLRSYWHTLPKKKEQTPLKTRVRYNKAISVHRPSHGAIRGCYRSYSSQPASS
ncbi:hypothetical protein L6452_42643 [Arctium lappa]|uniref:Uncharacterized protein n=1 Tax=Arctium lappa TaxID=4217 RepID=A0ACB8XK13_ARCLA|nr:hypothetical protein L6452_42643 [Arctium lappa]